MFENFHTGFSYFPYSEILVESPNTSLPMFKEKGIAENVAPYLFLRERHLQAMWLEQKYFKNLTTTEGEITVLSPGIWNSEGGPDFLKAHLKIGNRNVRGDVELHLSDESWYHHHHHCDEKYDRVILHVGYWNPKKPIKIANSQNKEIPCVHLENHLTIPESRIIKLIDLDLYPHKCFAGSGICANVLFQKLPESKAIDFFGKAAYWRLTQKREWLTANIQDPSDYMIGGIAKALGYKHNAEAFLQLCFHLKNNKSGSEKDLFVRALGICNFFDAIFRNKWTHSPLYRSLAEHFDGMPSENNSHRIALKIERTRPANHPVRRIALLIKMLNDPEIRSFYVRLKELWQAEWFKKSQSGLKRLSRDFQALLPNYRDSYWEHHYTFEEIPQKKAMILMGDDLKREILINVCLPLLNEDIEKRGIFQEKEAFQIFYENVSSSKTQKSTYLAHRFFGDTPKSRILQHAMIQQGAYQLHRDFCLHFEASCSGCPFVDRYKEIFT